MSMSEDSEYFTVTVSDSILLTFLLDTHAQGHTRIHINTHIHVRTHAHMYAHVHTRIHTHDKVLSHWV